MKGCYNQVFMKHLRSIFIEIYWNSSNVNSETNDFLIQLEFQTKFNMNKIRKIL